MSKTIITPELDTLRAVYAAGGYTLWVVGGATRDFIAGQESKDIDLATDARPNEQIELLESKGIRYVPTGLQHGTITVLVDGADFEVTSLRIDTNQDGRHADVEFTRDINEDLARRDLTINAIAMDFDGNFVDPFQGREDLSQGRVRFVGDARQRMEEDFLRILRYFRFHARFSQTDEMDNDALTGIKAARGGLMDISVERVWSEVSRIVAGPNAERTLQMMQRLSLFEIVRMPYGVYSNLSRARAAGVKDSAALMGFFLPLEQIDRVAEDWKWSRAERERAMFVATFAPESFDCMVDALVEDKPLEWVLDCAAYAGADEGTLQRLRDWRVPEFPVRGKDLLDMGMEAGPEMGERLKFLRQEWQRSRYTKTKEDLLAVEALTNF